MFSALTSLKEPLTSHLERVKSNYNKVLPILIQIIKQRVLKKSSFSALISLKEQIIKLRVLKVNKPTFTKLIVTRNRCFEPLLHVGNLVVTRNRRFEPQLHIGDVKSLFSALTSLKEPLTSRRERGKYDDNSFESKQAKYNHYDVTKLISFESKQAEYNHYDVTKLIVTRTQIIVISLISHWEIGKSDDNERREKSGGGREREEEEEASCGSESGGEKVTCEGETSANVRATKRLTVGEPREQGNQEEVLRKRSQALTSIWERGISNDNEVLHILLQLIILKVLKDDNDVSTILECGKSDDNDVLPILLQIITLRLLKKSLFYAITSLRKRGKLDDNELHIKNVGNRMIMTFQRFCIKEREKWDNNEVSTIFSRKERGKQDDNDVSTILECGKSDDNVVLPILLQIILIRKSLFHALTSLRECGKSDDNKKSLFRALTSRRERGKLDDNKPELHFGKVGNQTIMKLYTFCYN
ncbi:hypothetical protein Sjap_023948 [Stephania japonica]|uniref:Uncharacterized protein n=1 Tax=Stephania japonica TaxID=461633 RepID=A0AAP0ECJ8_9MAGN